VADRELLQMLSAEADRRVPDVKRGLDELARGADHDPAKLERLRVEVHGLRGAAMVIGESRLAELADRVEHVLGVRIEPGTIDPPLAGRLGVALDAFRDGARAAAASEPEPPSVAESLASLG
jgi:chemotaxis protein histidine kinase CheA